jgi:serine/threonine-protein kinase Chk2
VSGLHCRLYQDPEVKDEEGRSAVFLEDQSANGTWVNSVRIGKGKRVRCKNGDEISLVAGRGDTRIAFVFQDKRPEQAREVEEGGPERLYDIRETLGEGNFAVVKLCVHKHTGQKFAIKIIDKKKFSLDSRKGQEALLGEVRILQQLKHPNIISIQDVFETSAHLYIVLELVTGGDLFDRVVAKKMYPEAEARLLFRNLLEALRYLHEQGVAHRDLKPENILLASRDDDVTIKVSDFGLSKVVGEDQLMKTLCGTPQYLAPEIVARRDGKRAGYSKAVDLWACGVILYILLVGYPPFQENDFDAILHGRYNFNHARWKGVSNAAKDLVSQLLQVDPLRRLDVHQALAHPWLRGETEVFQPPAPPPAARANPPDPKPAPPAPRAKRNESSTQPPPADLAQTADPPAAEQEEQPRNKRKKTVELAPPAEGSGRVLRPRKQAKK